MAAVPNHALRQLRAGKLAIGMGINLPRTVNVAQLARTAGFDWLFIDCEHSALDLDTATQISSASLAVGITPVVRVAGLEHWHASRVLDNGAQGIVIAGNHVVHFVGVAIGVEDAVDRNLELPRLVDGNLLLACVDDENRVREA